MSEELKTIKELADELCISKQGVQYHLNYYHLKTRQKNNRGIIILTHGEQEFVRNRVKIQSAKDLSTKNTSAKDVSAKDLSTKNTSAKDVSAKGAEILLEKIEMQKIQLEDFKQQRERQEHQIAVKDKQMENKDNQISQMQNLLDQQQRLALQDKKLLEEYKAEISDLKSLNMPLEDTKKEPLFNAQKEVERLNDQLNSLEEKSAKIQEKDTLKPQSKKWWQLWK